MSPGLWTLCIGGIVDNKRFLGIVVQRFCLLADIRVEEMPGGEQLWVGSGIWSGLPGVFTGLEG